MVVLGVILIAGVRPTVIEVPAAAVRSLGAAGVAGGWFVFMALVADRCFPRVLRPLATACEVLALGAFASFLALAIGVALA